MATLRPSFWAPKLLFIITACGALVFQVYWLRSILDDKKLEMINQIDQVLQMELLKAILEADKGDRLTASSINANVAEVDSFIRVLGPSRIAPTLIVQEATSAISPQQALKQAMSGARDSVMYMALRSGLEWLPTDRKMILSRDENGVTTTYPRGQEKDPLIKLQVLPPGTQAVVYQAHVQGFDTIALGRMKLPLAASLVYMVMFLAALIVLFRNVMLNRRMLESHARFTRNMTHELKIPISTLHVATEALEKEHPERSFYTGAMRRALGQLTTIVDTILETASLEHRRGGLHKDFVDLHEVVSEMLGSLELRLRKEHISVELQGILPGTLVYADRTRLRQVLDNLVDNAMKYGGSPGHITIASRMEHGKDVISVTDKGPGIAPEHFEVIFEPYFRAASSDVHDVKGYGLGLSFVREVARLHGGGARVQRSGPEGTMIAISLPSYGQ